jgi:hypothetical protein
MPLQNVMREQDRPEIPRVACVLAEPCRALNVPCCADFIGLKLRRRGGGSILPLALSVAAGSEAMPKNALVLAGVLRRHLVNAVHFEECQRSAEVDEERSTVHAPLHVENMHDGPIESTESESAPCEAGSSKFGVEMLRQGAKEEGAIHVGCAA